MSKYSKKLYTLFCVFVCVFITNIHGKGPRDSELKKLEAQGVAPEVIAVFTSAFCDNSDLVERLLKSQTTRKAFIESQHGAILCRVVCRAVRYKQLNLLKKLLAFGDVRACFSGYNQGKELNWSLHIAVSNDDQEMLTYLFSVLWFSTHSLEKELSLVKNKQTMVQVEVREDLQGLVNLLASCIDKNRAICQYRGKGVSTIKFLGIKKTAQKVQRLMQSVGGCSSTKDN